MKALTSILVMFTIVGCSTDELQPDPTIEDTQFYKKSGLRTTDPKNPHAHVGVIYQDMLNAYYLLPDNAFNLQHVIDRAEAIALLNPDFVNLNDDAAYVSLSSDDIAPYLTDGALTELLTEEYSTHAVGILTEIASQLDILKAQNLPFQDVEAYFKEVDAAIVDDTTLEIEEQEALLITTSLICNAMDNDRKRKRRDRDWEWMTTHLAATANAALESVPQAIMMSLVTDVYQQ
jgi:hypothetical protein